MKSLLGFSILLTLTILSCTKPPDYPIEPVIEFSHLSRPFMNQGSLNNDSLVMTFTFTDGDGDLGSENDSIDIFVSDTRIAADPITYKLPFVPQQGTGNGISGDISVLLFNTCCIFPNNVPPPCTPSTEFPVDTLIYEVYIRDRAGNFSNTIQTEGILLQCN